MLVGMFNAVKVESVPLKSEFFHARRVGQGFARHVRDAGPMHARVAAAAVFATVGVATAGSASAATDEDQVRAVLSGMNGSYNSTDYHGFAIHLCGDLLRRAGFEAGWYASRKSDGPTQITINSVQVTEGPRPLAIANVRFQAANRTDTKIVDVQFQREGADWKACRYDTGQYI
jgi:hypothetical protein